MNVSQLPSPSSTINLYLGLALDDENKYISVSTKTFNLKAKKPKNSIDEITLNQKQTCLFQKVINLIGSDLNAPYLLNSYSTEYEKDIRFEVKAQIIVDVFFKALDKELIKDKFQAFHRLNLANALFTYSQINFESKSLQISAKQRQSIPSFTFSSDFQNQSTGSSSPRTPTSPKIRKISDAKPHLSKSLQNLDVNEHQSLSAYRSRPLSQEVKKDALSNEIPRKTSTKEVAVPNPLFAGLSLKCLNYCQCYWIHKITKNDDFKNTVKEWEVQISKKDTQILNSSKFLKDPKLGILLQERIVRSLNNPDVKALVSDINRSLDYVTVRDGIGTHLFTYESNPQLNDVETSEHNCAQFGKFLLIVIKKLENFEHILSHPTIKKWESCVEKESTNITNHLFLNAVQSFINELAKTSIESRLKMLLSIFTQSSYVEPSSAINSCLYNYTKVKSAGIRSIKLQFIKESEIEVYVRNPIKFLKDEYLVDLIVVNKLSADLSQENSWSSKITVHSVPSVLTPMPLDLKILETIGIDFIDHRIKRSLSDGSIRIATKKTKK